MRIRELCPKHAAYQRASPIGLPDECAGGARRGAAGRGRAGAGAAAHPERPAPPRPAVEPQARPAGEQCRVLQLGFASKCIVGDSAERVDAWLQGGGCAVLRA